MFLRSASMVLLAVLVLCSGGYSRAPDWDKAAFSRDTEEEKGIFAKSKLEERRNFFHLFNVPYIICFFAAKGKWPFVPSFMQVQVDQVGRSIFPQTDGFIRNYCRKWIQIKECFRPHNIIPIQPETEFVTPQPVPAINTEVETVPINTTPCMCNQRYLDATQAPVVYFDKNYIGNVSSDVILNTIEFLESFLPPPTKKPKRKNRIRDRN